jgi:hypothetical protein
MSGLAIPFAYLLAALSLPAVVNQLVNKRRVLLQVGLLLLGVQVFSTLLAISSPYLEPTRFIAILHNYAVFGFILVGAALYSIPGYRAVLVRNLAPAILSLIVAALVAYLYSLKTGGSFGYDTVTGPVNYVGSGFLSGSVIPRLSAFGVYSNSAAIFFCSLYFLYSIESPDKVISAKGVFVWLLLVTVIGMTGSRIALASALAFYPLFWARSRISVSLLLVGGFAGLLWLTSVGGLDFILESRSGSTATRFNIYQQSLSRMFDQSIVFGIGIKPYVSEVPNYPLGSHSAILGYFFKQGLLGGGIVTLLILYALYRYMMTWLVPVLINGSVARPCYVAELSVVMLILIYAFEDLDAFEINAFLLGCILSTARRSDRLMRLVRAQSKDIAGQSRGRGELRSSRNGQIQGQE